MEQSRPAISVIIPVYNGSEMLSGCLDDLLKETGEVPMEIIAVDDGSGDNSRQILEAYSKKYPGILSVFLEKNSGTLAARKAGFEKSSGDYILALDQDDRYDPGAMAEIYRIARETRADIVQFGARIRNGEQTRTYFRFKENEKPGNLFRKAQTGQLPHPLWCKLIRRQTMAKAYRRLGELPFIIGPEDVPVTLSLARDSAVRWHFSSRIVYTHRVHPLAVSFHPIDNAEKLIFRAGNYRRLFSLLERSFGGRTIRRFILRYRFLAFWVILKRSFPPQTLKSLYRNYALFQKEIDREKHPRKSGYGWRFAAEGIVFCTKNAYRWVRTQLF